MKNADNDLAEHTTSTVRLFADDCVMYKSVKSVRDCQGLQQDLIQLQAWQERWQLRFNPKKCNVLRATHATRKKIEYPYTLDVLLVTSEHRLFHYMILRDYIHSSVS